MADEVPKKAAALNPIIQGILFLLVTIAIIHVVRTRSAAEIWDHSWILATFLCVFAVITYITLWFTLTPKPPFKFLIGVLLLLPIAAIFMGFVYYSVGASLKDFFLWIRDPNTVSWRAAAASLLVLATGSVLFCFRLRLRSIYGATEALIGVGVAMQRVVGTPKGAVALTPDVFLALLTASVYLVVRGLDNIHQGLTKDPLDPVAATIVKWLRRGSSGPAPNMSTVSAETQNTVKEASESEKLND